MDRAAILLFCIIVYSISGVILFGQLPSSPTINFSVGPPPSLPWEWVGYVADILAKFFAVTFDLIALAGQVMTFSWIPIPEIQYIMSMVFGILFVYSVLPAIQKIVEIIVEAIPL